VGSVATPFARAGGTIQGELAACQRYYYGVSASTALGIGEVRNASTAYAVIKLPVTMRVVPTCTFPTPTGFYVNSAGKTGAAVSVATDIAAVDFLSIIFSGLSGYTSGQASYIGTTTGTITASSEL
jgi:hypothetical protein